MCGIAGYVRTRASGRGLDEDELMRLRDRMTARGPDDCGLWTDGEGRVGLAHRRLAIIDLSAAGRQPMEDPETGNRIVFNGEIYNYRELAEQLRAYGIRPRTQSDTEIILLLYRLEGMAMLPKLRGMFAFAIWDAGGRALNLARDPHGIKPLYWADAEGTFVFASQVRALRELPALRARQPLPAAKVAFLLLGHIPEPMTVFTGIAAVPSGCWLRVDETGVGAPVSYASVGDALAVDAAGVDDAGHDRQAGIRRLIEETVRNHMVADVPVGVFLSAGRDSAVLAAAAGRFSSDRLRTVTLSFDEFVGSPYDEAPLAEETARALQTDHRTVRIRRADFDDELPRVLGAMDQPTVDGINVYFVSKAAAETGLKVALSGLGADEIFGGYSHFRTIPPLVAALRPLRRFRGVGALARRSISPVVSRWGSPKHAGIAEYGTSISDAYLLSRALFAPWEIASVMDPDEAAAGLAALADSAEALDAGDCGATDHARLVSLETTRYMRNQLLRDADWASMAHSVEVRVPFADYTLLEGLAPMIAGPRPPTKSDMLEPFRSLLPAGVARRSKTGFGIPVGQWLRHARPENGSNGNSPPWLRRGLRPWALHVYDHFARNV